MKAKINLKKIKSSSLILLLVFALLGCTTAQIGTNSEAAVTETASSTSTVSTSTDNLIRIESSALDTSNLFSNRDLNQTPDLSDASYITMKSNNDITISDEGIYVLTGNVENVTVKVDAEDTDKVQILLDSATIVNENAPAIYVKSADKVFVTTSDSTNSLEVSGSFAADGDTNLDAVIFSKSDITLNGTGSLSIVSAEGNGITGKDDLKFTGGTYSITSAKDSIEANDSIRIYDGEFTIESGKDGLHSENEDDLDLGYIYIKGGTLTINAADDGIQGTTIVQIDGGTINIPSSSEGIEGTYIQINDGNIDIYASDDGINAAQKGNGTVKIEVNGGTIAVEVGSGDTDGFDSNGDIYINGGTISVTARSAFDPDGVAELNGGTVTVNGTVITEIAESRMGGGGGGGGRHNKVDGTMDGTERPERPDKNGFPGGTPPTDQAQ